MVERSSSKSVMITAWESPNEWSAARKRRSRSMVGQASHPSLRRFQWPLGKVAVDDAANIACGGFNAGGREAASRLMADKRGQFTGRLEVAG